MWSPPQERALSPVGLEVDASTMNDGVLVSYQWETKIRRSFDLCLNGEIRSRRTWVQTREFKRKMLGMGYLLLISVKPHPGPKPSNLRNGANERGMERLPLALGSKQHAAQ